MTLVTSRQKSFLLLKCWGLPLAIMTACCISPCLKYRQIVSSFKFSVSSHLGLIFFLPYSITSFISSAVSWGYKVSTGMTFTISCQAVEKSSLFRSDLSCIKAHRAATNTEQSGSLFPSVCRKPGGLALTGVPVYLVVGMVMCPLSDDLCLTGCSLPF